jgi:hypothetical protein
MPKKADNPMIVARYGDKVAGWVGSEKGGRLYGDEEWVKSAKDAAAANLEFTLYEDIDLRADIDDPNNPAGAFAALAWFARERIRISKAPEGMMDALGLLDTPAELDVLDGWDGEATEEERLFLETHVEIEVDGESVWVPLAKLQTTPESRFNALEALRKALSENA